MSSKIPDKSGILICRFKIEGHEEVLKNATSLLGCPITGPWSLEDKTLKQ